MKLCITHQYPKTTLIPLLLLFRLAFWGSSERSSLLKHHLLVEPSTLQIWQRQKQSIKMWAIENVTLLFSLIRDHSGCWRCVMPLEEGVESMDWSIGVIFALSGMWSHCKVSLQEKMEVLYVGVSKREALDGKKGIKSLDPIKYSLGIITTTPLTS